MPIYTRTGDQGKTSLFGGKRVSKSDKRIEAYGSIDETNSCIGVLSSLVKEKDAGEFLQQIQKQLFQIASNLAGHKSQEKLKLNTSELEKEIDRLQNQLPPLHNFIYITGNKSSTFAHFTRSVVRRAERQVVSLSQGQSVQKEILEFLNRLSDYLFVLARTLNKKAGYKDETLQIDN